MAGNTIKLHRVLKAPVSRVYRAFTDGDAMASWCPPNGFYAKTHEVDFKVGGHYRMSFTNLTTGKSQFFGGKYLEIKPHELIRYTDQFEDPNLPGAIEMTITFKEVICGTEVTITQTGLPEAIPVEFCYLGWDDSFAKLRKLVEPEINEG